MKRKQQRGSVTAELAIGLPAVIVLLALMLLGASAGMTTLRLDSAARAGARILARGDPPEVALAAVHSQAGAGVTATVSTDGGFATVQVTGHATGPLSDLLTFPLTASATAHVESPSALHWPVPAGLLRAASLG